MMATVEQRTAATFLATAMALALHGGDAVAADLTAADAAREISGFSYPEAVFRASNTLYVSNMNSPGDGFISKVDWRSGRIEALRFLPRSGGLRNPMGMLVLGHILYVADSPNVVGFDLRDGRQVFDLAIPASGRLNDLAAAPGACGHKTCFFVSDDARNRILKVIPQEASYTVYAEGVRGANGLAFDAWSQTLYVAGLSERTAPGAYVGALYAVKPNPLRTLKLVETGTFPDGIALYRGRVYFSDWGNTLSNGYIASIAVNNPGQVRQETALRTLNGPADFALAREDGRLFVPALVESTVIVQRLAAEDCED